MLFVLYIPYSKKKCMRRVLPVIVVAFVFISCKKESLENPNAVNSTDQTFMLQMAKEANAEVEAANSAEGKSNNAVVQQFSRAIATNYSMALTDLKALAKKLNFSLPEPNNDEEEFTNMNELSGYSFDTSYMNSRVQSLALIMNNFKNEVDNGNNPYVRYYYVNKYLDSSRACYLRAASIAYSIK